MRTFASIREGSNFFVFNVRLKEYVMLVLLKRINNIYMDLLRSFSTRKHPIPLYDFQTFTINTQRRIVFSNKFIIINVWSSCRFRELAYRLLVNGWNCRTGKRIQVRGIVMKKVKPTHQFESGLLRELTMVVLT